MDGSSEDDSFDNEAPLESCIVIPSYALEVGLYFTNARSSFWSDIPVNCATTILLNPVAFAPSARTPFIPNTERNDTLKM